LHILLGLRSCCHCGTVLVRSIRCLSPPWSPTLQNYWSQSRLSFCSHLQFPTSSLFAFFALKPHWLNTCTANTQCTYS
jgi:hypothetical protein